MRLFFLCLLCSLASFDTDAQINRSAKEFAGERIQEYITNKLFKSQQYKPISYGDLKSYVDKKSAIVWIMTHEFEITDKAHASPKSYQFFFYLDEKMSVIRAEASYSN